MCRRRWWRSSKAPATRSLPGPPRSTRWPIGSRRSTACTSSRTARSRTAGRASCSRTRRAGPSAVSEEEFLGKFGERSLRLVFLQACKSAARKPGVPNVMSGLAPKVARRAAGVVAMQDFVRVDDARRFAQQFYDTLLSTGLADVAANAGRRALYRPDSRNWAIPALYLTPKAERLWEPDARAAGRAGSCRTVRPQVGRHAAVPGRRHPAVAGRVVEDGDEPARPARARARGRLVRTVPGGGARATIADRRHRGQLRARQDRAALSAVRAATRSRRHGATSLPFFAQISDFQSAEDTPEQTLAAAIAATYKRLGIEVRAERSSPTEADRSSSVSMAIQRPTAADAPSRSTACRPSRRPTPAASAVVALDEQLIAQTPALNSKDRTRFPSCIVQLLSPATVAQYLNGLGDDYKGLLASLQRANLFDLAGVPWLLSHLIRYSNRGGLSRSGRHRAHHHRQLRGGQRASRRPPHRPRSARPHGVDAADAAGASSRRRARLRAPRSGARPARGAARAAQDHALDTKIVAAIDEDAIRFSYPGFQSYWCAQHLVDSGASLYSQLDDITATLGRRSRVRHWEDTLVLLAGMMDHPERLVRPHPGRQQHGLRRAGVSGRALHSRSQAGRPRGRTAA